MAKTLNELKQLVKGASNIQVYYYSLEIDEVAGVEKPWTLEYSFRTETGGYENSEYFKDNRHYKTESAATTQAKRLAANLGGKFTGRAWDMEV